MANEISREALISYLENLRILETITYLCESKLQSLERQKKQIVFNQGNPPQEPTEPKKPPKPHLMKWLIMMIIGIGLLVLCYFLFLSLSVFLALGCLAVGTINFFEGIDENNKAKKRYESAIESYKQNCASYPERLAKYQKWKQQALTEYNRKKQKCQAVIDKVYNEKNNVSEILEEAYSMNIIPRQFRNIQGIYYLYDYISTSNESLSNALLHANLEEIKRKMDEIIRLESDSIILEEKWRAEERQFNQRMLELSQRTEENSRLSAQYGEIAALNSQTSIQLQEESLAYQKADYWLK